MQKARTLETSLGGAPPREQLARTVCAANCGGRSLLDCTVRDGRLVRVEAGEYPDAAYTAACVRCLSLPQWVYSPERVRSPMRRVGERGEGRFAPVSWDEALDEIAAKLAALRDRHGGESIAFTRTSGASPMGNFLRLTGLLQASNFYGGVDMAVHMGLNATFGYRGMFGQHTNEWTDRANAALLLCWGSNPAETSMTTFRHLLDAREQGMQLVVIDPRYSPTALHADWWIAPRPGSDLALALGLAHIIVRDGHVDRDFAAAYSVAPLLVRHDDGRYLRAGDIGLDAPAAAYVVWDAATEAAVADGRASAPALERSVEVGGQACSTVYTLLCGKLERYDPDSVAAATGLEVGDIEDLAHLYATAKPATIGFGYGVDRYVHADQLTRAGAILALLTGDLGRPGAGVGVQSHGKGSYGEEVALSAGFRLPEWARSHSVPNAVVGRRPLPVRALFNQGDWLNQRVADQNTLIDFVRGLELVVTVDHFWQSSAQWSDYMLPASTFLESFEPLRDLVVTRNSVLLREKVIDPLYDSWPDAEIERALAERLGYGEHYAETTEEILRAQLDDSPAPELAGITLDRLREAGGALRLNVPEAPHVQYADLRFATPTGRAEFYLEQLVDLGEALPTHKDDTEASPRHPSAQGYPLVFTQTHARQRAHSTFFNLAWALEIWPEPVVELSVADARERGVVTGDVVEVFNDRGHVVVKALVSADYPPGMCNITEGWKEQQFIAGNLQQLTNPAINPAQERLWTHANIAFYDTRVEIRPIPHPGGEGEEN